MGIIISFTFAFLVYISVHTSLHLHTGASDDLSFGNPREALEIIIGGGGGAPSPDYQDYPPPPPEPLCPPPPPPPCPPPPPPPCPPPPPPRVVKPTPRPPSPPPPRVVKPTPLPPSPQPPLTFESERIRIVYQVIQDFKKKITCDPYRIKETWVGSDICHKYKGFFCDTVPDLKLKALAGVNFNGYNFSGPNLTLSGFMDSLPDIAIFHANSNCFTGAIPKSITNLRYLYELDLSNNNFTGKFPSEVLSASRLTFLDLRFNSLSGLVPPQVFLLDLDVLFINNNNFFQKLPDNLGSTPVHFLTLANNRFIGEIPPSIGQASKTLIEVLFLNNYLYGCLPYEIGLLANATVFDVGFNQLTGPIPHSFACLDKIQQLNLARNKFYGPVPELVCMLPSLLNFSLSYNYFTQVGPECRKLIQNKKLDVRMNCILDLPMQRSPSECAAFFSRPTSCPDQKSLTWIPCGKRAQPNSLQPSDHYKSTAPAPQPRSYGALTPH